MIAPQSQSIQEQNKQLVARWFDEVWNQGRRETIHEMFAEQGVLHDGNHNYRGPVEFSRFYDGLKAQFSSISIRPIIGLADGDLICSHFYVECVHSATGKRVEFTAIAIIRIANGQFAEAWQNWDQAGVATQLAD